MTQLLSALGGTESFCKYKSVNRGFPGPGQVLMAPVTRAGWQGQAGPDWWWEDDADGDGGYWDDASCFSTHVVALMLCFPRGSRSASVLERTQQERRGSGDMRAGSAPLEGRFKIRGNLTCLFGTRSSWGISRRCCHLQCCHPPDGHGFSGPQIPHRSPQA